MGNVYSFAFSNGDAISFEIKKRNVPHLLGIGRLPLRQVHGKYAIQLYAMLKNGKLTLEHITSVSGHKEVYKKIMNFHHIVAMLHCGEAVKVVKRIGSLNSSYLLYLDHQPTEIVHLGIVPITQEDGTQNLCLYFKEMLQRTLITSCHWLLWNLK